MEENKNNMKIFSTERLNYHNMTPESLVGKQLILVDDLHATDYMNGDFKNIIIKEGEKISIVTARYPYEPKVGVIKWKGKEYNVNIDPLLNKIKL